MYGKSMYKVLEGLLIVENTLSPLKEKVRLEICGKVRIRQKLWFFFWKIFWEIGIIYQLEEILFHVIWFTGIVLPIMSSMITSKKHRSIYFCIAWCCLWSGGKFCVRLVSIWLHSVTCFHRWNGEVWDNKLRKRFRLI